MCIICIEIEKNKLSAREARANLTEIIEQIDEDHVLEVKSKILNKESQEIFSEFDFSKIDDSEICEICEICPCDCDWEVYKWENF